MGQRIDLQRKLESILGSKNVYFQPPDKTVLKYPCIIYSLDYMSTKFADNNPYNVSKRYNVAYIDRRPDSDIPDQLAMMHMTTFSSHMATEGLNHYYFNTYF